MSGTGTLPARTHTHILPVAAEPHHTGAGDELTLPDPVVGSMPMEIKVCSPGSRHGVPGCRNPGGKFDDGIMRWEGGVARPEHAVDLSGSAGGLVVHSRAGVGWNVLRVVVSCVTYLITVRSDDEGNVQRVSIMHIEVLVGTGISSVQ